MTLTKVTAKPKATAGFSGAVIAMALLLSGCDFYSVLPSTIISTVANIAPIDTAVILSTDKTIADHMVSMSSGKDCSTVRREQGRTYCVEDEKTPRPEVVCFKSLGDITCYSKDDPLLPKENQVASDQY